MKIEIRPEWLLKKEDGEALSLPLLLRLLTEIRDRGSIAAAAASIGLSYRHGWGVLRAFEALFRAPLVKKTRGQGTGLTPLADKLIWADKRIAARLSPIFDSLASELEHELGGLLPGAQGTLRVVASHGFAVAALMQELEKRACPVDLRYRSSTEAVASLARSECDFAGFHLPLGEFEAAAARQYMQWLDPARHALVLLAHRTQGLFVAKGNPKGIHSLSGLAREDVRFVNRQIGSGTRLLLELLLKRDRVDSSQIPGFEIAEFTHAAVAAYVGSDMADASFGLEAAARRFDLDFIPVVRERYFLACRKQDLDNDKLAPALQVLRSDSFRVAIDALPGYDGAGSGEVVALEGLW